MKGDNHEGVEGREIIKKKFKKEETIMSDLKEDDKIISEL